MVSISGSEYQKRSKSVLTLSRQRAELTEKIEEKQKAPDRIRRLVFQSNLSLHVHCGEGQDNVPAGGLAKCARWLKGSEYQSIVDLHAHRIRIVA